MQAEYRALPGGDGGEWVTGETPPARHLLPVAQSTNSSIAGSNGLGTVEALPVRSAIVRIENENYHGFAARMRLNPRRSVVRELSSGEIGPVAKAIASLVLTWNFRGEDGQALDPTPEEVEDLPDDLLSALITGYFETFAEATTPKEG